MNYTGICITLLVAASLCLTTIIHKRRGKETQLVKEANFEEIRATVTKDVLTENLGELDKSETQVKTMKTGLLELRDKLMTEQTQAKNLAVDIEECNGEAKRSSDALANLEGQKSSLSSEFEKDKAEWSKEIASLTEEASQQSKVCNYIIKTSDEGRKLCGLPAEVPAEQEKPKAEVPAEQNKEKPKDEVPAEQNKEKPKAEDTNQAIPEAPKQR